MSKSTLNIDGAKNHEVGSEGRGQCQGRGGYHGPISDRRLVKLAGLRSQRVASPACIFGEARDCDGMWCAIGTHHVNGIENSRGAVPGDVGDGDELSTTRREPEICGLAWALCSRLALLVEDILR